MAWMDLTGLGYIGEDYQAQFWGHTLLARKGSQG
jgi:hypothetical protein